jgi:hypothetical protein
MKQKGSIRAVLEKHMKQVRGIRAVLGKHMKQVRGIMAVLGEAHETGRGNWSCALFQHGCALGYVLVVWYVL